MFSIVIYGYFQGICCSENLGNHLRCRSQCCQGMLSVFIQIAYWICFRKLRHLTLHSRRLSIATKYSNFLAPTLLHLKARNGKDTKEYRTQLFLRCVQLPTPWGFNDTVMQGNNRLVWDESVKIMEDLFTTTWESRDINLVNHCDDLTLPVWLLTFIPNSRLTTPLL